MGSEKKESSKDKKVYESYQSFRKDEIRKSMTAFQGEATSQPKTLKPKRITPKDEK